MNKTHILRHKNLDVALLHIKEGSIIGLEEIIEKEHMPIKYEEEKNKNIYLLNKWIENRGIPLSREDIDIIKEKYHVDDAKELTVLGRGLNLTDHYWLCEYEERKIKWKDVNFIQNNFSTRIGELFPELDEKYKNFANPDFSSNGRLKKYWKIDGEERVLYKAGSGDLRQEPFNEVISSEIAKMLNIPHVEYKLALIENEPYCKCNCMIDDKVEYIDSFKVFLNGEKNNKSYDNYINICVNKGIVNARDEIDKMLVLDYLIRNTDRNDGNFGVLRNSETLQWVKVAKMFDNGNSFWYNTSSIKNIKADDNSNCRSFIGKNEENIKLIGAIEWFNKNLLKNSEKMIVDYLKENKNMEMERIEKIANEFTRRITKLENDLKNDKLMSKINTKEIFSNERSIIVQRNTNFDKYINMGTSKN